ncbi:dethiobiotin synthase [Rugosimonospora acidiphila]|uniref:ATP-dependent dethiobiotin synthetase BioD n=1 Tax=Rugosimonospora acidiphila TaxID=556531 RepID=A0ABP9RNM0_9ACTN
MTATVWVVSGTDTEVGKTVVTSAIAAAASVAGHRVAVIKPGQSGIASGEPSDVDVVNRLAAPVTALTLANYPDALAPLAAAEQVGASPLALGDVIESVERTAANHDVVLIEGSGGLLVPMGEGRWTVADLALALRCPTVVVARAGLGTLNHTALTLEALERRSLIGYPVIGAWPGTPELVHWRNLADLAGELVGVLPEGAGAMDPAQFRAAARSWLSPLLYGRADPQRLRTDGVTGPPPDWPGPVALL